MCSGLLCQPVCGYVTTMSLLTFRTLCEDLKNVPCEANPISKQFRNKDLARLLSTAMKALSVAETVIAKQSDAILYSSIEMNSYIHENRISESLPNGFRHRHQKTILQFFCQRWK